MKSLVQTRELCSGSMLRERVAGASSLVCTGLNVQMLLCCGSHGDLMKCFKLRGNTQFTFGTSTALLMLDTT